MPCAAARAKYQRAAAHAFFMGVSQKAPGVVRSCSEKRSEPAPRATSQLEQTRSDCSERWRTLVADAIEDGVSQREVLVARVPGCRFGKGVSSRELCSATAVAPSLVFRTRWW